MNSFITGHEDLIHDIAYDYYGTRIATCSSDQHVKIFDLDENTGKWTLNDSFHPHEASVTRVVWANPEFGQVIATCSFDRTVKIFEEQDNEPRGSGRRWSKLTVLLDSRGPVHDIWFAPAQFGLKLAAIGTDATLRIYEALEPSNLHYWSLIVDTEIVPSPSRFQLPSQSHNLNSQQQQQQKHQKQPQREAESAYCLTWCPSKFAPEQIAVCALSYACVYRKDQNTGQYLKAEELPGHGSLIRDVSWAPEMGRSYQLIATACRDGYVRIFQLSPNNQAENMEENNIPDNKSNNAGNSKSNLNTFENESLFNPPQSNFLQNSGSSVSSNLNKLTNNSSGTSSSTSIGLSISLGTANETGKNNESKLNSTNGMENKSNTKEAKSLYTVKLIGEFDDHKAEVWRVSWNVTGTLLSSAGDDGKIRLWKAAYSGQFQCMSVISAEQKKYNYEDAIEE